MVSNAVSYSSNITSNALKYFSNMTSNAVKYLSSITTKEGKYSLDIASNAVKCSSNITSNISIFLLHFCMVLLTVFVLRKRCSLIHYGVVFPKLQHEYYTLFPVLPERLNS